MGWRRRIRFWHVAVSIPVVLVMVGTIGTVVVTNRAKAEAEAERVVLQSYGVPTTAAEMRRKVDVKANAAPIYRDAIRLLESHPVPSRPDWDRKSGKAEEVAAMRKWIAENRPALARFREAAALPDCDFGRHWEAGASLSFPELGHMKTFVKMSAWEAGEAADAGRPDEALEWLEMALRAGRHVREPVLIGTLLSTAIDMIVLREFDREVRLAAGDPQFTVRARKLLDSLGDLPSLEVAMGGEVMFIHEFFSKLDRGDASELKMIYTSETPKPVELAMRYPAIRAKVEALILKRYRHLFDDLRAHRGELLEIDRAFRQHDTDVMADQSLMGQLASTVAPTFAGMGQSQLRLESIRRLSRAGLELWAIRRATGEFPEALDLRKPWNLDPIAESAFVYRRTTLGFVLYGVGYNKNDDGGSLRFGTKRTDDLEFGGAP